VNAVAELRLPPERGALEASARRLLSPRRLRHVAGVAAMAEALAAAYGVDREAAACAAWAHDLLRERAPQELLEAAETLGVPVLPEERRAPVLLHGPVAAALLAREGAAARVVEAVRVHTTGRAGMGEVAEVLFVSDKVEAGRDYPEAAAVRRRIGEASLEQLVFAVLQAELCYLIREGRLLHRWAVGLYEAYAGGGP
jgi:predicted HD superfamily hydrolase involved in NAD metabolism